MNGIGDYRQVIGQIKAFEHVAACAPYIEGPALIKIRGSKEFVYFKGVDPCRGKRWGFRGNFLPPLGTGRKTC